jgi:hypothetical protein
MLRARSASVWAGGRRSRLRPNELTSVLGKPKL